LSSSSHNVPFPAADDININISINIAPLTDKTADDINALIENHVPPPSNLEQLNASARYAPFRPVLNETHRRIFFDLAQKLSEVCTTHGVVCMMYGGTLLGSYRHHDLIPWDDDLDILITHRKRGLISRELKKISGGYHVEYAGPRIKFYSSAGSQNSKYPWRWPYVDISFYTENDTHIVDTAKDMRKYSYPKSIIFPVHKRPLADLELDAPRDTFAALKLTYASKHCQSYHYSHRTERANTNKKHVVGCRELGEVYGFVHRSALRNDTAILETLMRGGKVVHVKRVEEPPTAITKPYMLELL
jgi:hypothetical protein